MDNEKNKKMILYDLAFGIILITVCAFFIFKSATMPRPRTWLTAPGTPPLIIFISLGCMGLSLFINAIRARGLQILKERWSRVDARTSSLNQLLRNKTVLLTIIFFFYFIVFTKIFPFELSTFIYLFITFKIFWKRTTLITLVTTLLITISFSYVFSEVFKVMLPGVAWRDFLPV
ncbi:MAG: tripartite tricarboxylate transporter TctB family protein [Desulfobacterales bacterium]|nr:tripartite tricarboxylate transporter TctB family protein [Desulfobacterales bacterium]